jgi:excisionase family DNA binding protein
MLLTIKQVSEWLNIKSSTLYLWAGQGKIPCRKIHGLIRFDRDKITGWLASFDQKPGKPVPELTESSPSEIDHLIEAAKRAAYTARHGETISPSPDGKEQNDGAR